MKCEPAISAHRDDTLEAYETSVERVICHMKAHLDAPLDLDEIARIAIISKFHLVRVFDEITGTTPHHFLSCLRIQRAKEILLETDTPVTDVCLDVGYNSLGTFSKTFTELVGVSPQEFRALPRRLTAKQFATTIWRYLATRRKVFGPAVQGVVEGPGTPKGFIFVGTFTSGVPLGVPFSGTIMAGHGKFCLERPAASRFHLLAALVPFSANLAEMVVNIPISLVASLRVSEEDFLTREAPRLCLRPLRPTDPPIVMALPTLPPLRS